MIGGPRLRPKVCRVGYQRALRCPHLGKAPPRSAIRGRRMDYCGRRPGLPCSAAAGPLHLVQHEMDFHHLKINIGLPRRIGTDRHQIVRGACHLNAVAGKVEDSATSAALGSAARSFVRRCPSAVLSRSSWARPPIEASRPRSRSDARHRRQL